MKLRRVMLSAAIALLAALAVTGSALATPGNGATKTKQSFCDSTTFPGATVCYDLNYVVNQTQTPSGNVSFVTNGKNTIVDSTASGCTFTGDTSFHQHYLLKNGTLFESGAHEVSSFTANCFGQSTTCTYTLQAHYTNGSFQYYRPEFTCTP